MADIKKTLLIAELSANHGGSLKTALKTLSAIAESGADAVKLQTYKPDTITLKSDNSYFRIQEGTIWDGQTLFDLYNQAFLPWEWHEALFDEAKKLGLICFSSPFDHSAVDFLEKFDPPYYKIASFEINDLPLIQRVAQTGKPIIMSTGMASEEDIQAAVDMCKNENLDDITLLKCTSSYPAPLHLSNLNTIPLLRERFGVKVGLSDHTEGYLAPVVAVSLGATMIEKHFILDRSIGGADASFSMEPKQFAEMVSHVRLAETALGNAKIEVPENLKKNLKFRRSLFWSRPVKKGDVIMREDVKSVRPSFGLAPIKINEVIGSVATQDLQFGTPVKEGQFE